MIRLFALLFFSILLVGGDPASAQPRPLWEFGLGLSGLSLTHYNGSQERQNLLLPLPYFVYRGDVLRVDRNNAYGKLLERGRFKLGISVGGNVPADSEDGARQGMPDLEPVIELGPSLTWLLHNDADYQRDLVFELPLRAAVTVDGADFDHIGWLGNPRLKYSFRPQWADARTRIQLTAGARFGDQQYHNYFYGVAPAFVTVRRAQFDTAGGYGGWGISAGLSRRSGNRWYGAFVRYLNLSGAQFETSPLVETGNAVIGGFAVAWILRSSTKLVE